MRGDAARLYSEVGLLIAFYRRKSRISQETLAEQIGLSRASITNIERGRQAVSLLQIYQFAGALGVPVHELLPAETVLPNEVTPAGNYLQRLKSISLPMLALSKSE